MEWVIDTMPRLLYPWETEAVPFVQEAGCATGPVWTGAQNLATTLFLLPLLNLLLVFSFHNK
jgi:hypothetical protein